MNFTTLFFDLDDTLYPPSAGLWGAIKDRMNQYMQELLGLPLEQVTALRQAYLENFGTTLRGLQHNYQVDPDAYLAYVHNLPLEEYIQPDPELRATLLSLPQRRWVFTNADADHARRVLSRLGMVDCFEGIVDIRATGYVCKPEEIAYQRALALAGESDPQRCVLFDDALRNLIPARALGFHTVLVGRDGPNPKVDHSLASLDDLRQAMPGLWRS